MTARFISDNGKELRWTPFRRGYDAARTHAGAFRRWKVQPLGERGPAPQPPANPYTVHRSMDGWAAGWRAAMVLFA